MLLYLVVLLGTIWALESRTLADGVRYAIAVLPALPLVGVIILVVQSISSEDDEFQRVLWAESMLWGTAITMAATTVWGFLEVAGAPHVRLYWIFPFFAASALIALLFLREKYR
jgi:hypothetical protein